MGSDAQGTKVHRSAVQAAAPDKRAFHCLAAGGAGGDILEDHDKYYTFS